MYYFEHDTGNFLRGNTAGRFASYATAIQNGILTINECRGMENKNPVEGGDDILIPLNMQKGAEAPEDGDDVGSRGNVGTRSFPITGGLRAGAGKNDAAKGFDKCGINAAALTSLKKAFGEWIGGIAEDVSQIAREAEEKRSIRTDVKELTKALNEYFDKMREGSLSDDIIAAFKDSIASAKETIARKLEKGVSDTLDQEWDNGFLARYEKDARNRLCRAAENEVRHMIGNGDISIFLKKVEEWSEASPEKIAENEARYIGNEYLVAGYRANGYSSIWIASTAECEVCKRLNGQTITNLMPPLHLGCGCFVVSKKAGAFTHRENESGVTFGIDKEGKYGKISKGDRLNDDDEELEFCRWKKEKEIEIVKGEGIEDIKRLIEFYGGKKENGER